MKKVRIFSLLLAIALVLTGCGKVPGKPLSLGRMEDGSYRNAYTGFGFDLDESWVFTGADELAGGVDWEVMEGEIADHMEGREQFADFQAENPESLTTVNLVYTTQTGSERVGNGFLSDGSRADQVLDQRAALEEAYAQAGISVVAMEKVQVKFLGRDTWAVKTAAKIGDVDYYILQTFGNSTDPYCTVLTCASFVEDRTGELLGMFYELK